jgi:adenosylmethionine-8-amino-7-oxononanoate aminotransferase
MNWKDFMTNKKEIIDIDRNYIWHPFTQMKDYENIDPVVIVKGKGVKLFDIDNNEYYDTISSWWTNTIGHCNEKLAKAVSNQMNILEHVNFSGFTHPFATDLIKGLNTVLPKKLNKYFFSDNGSTAVEVALKMAFQYWQNKGIKNKTKFAMFENAYHGDTIGAVSVGGVDLFHQIYKPLMFETTKLKAPNCSNCPFRNSPYTFDAEDTNCNFECFKSVEETLTKEQDNLAAVVIEPLLQGAGGMLVYPAKYLEMLKRLTEELGIILIFDEVATGFGRTGKLFAFQHTNIVPDIICLSKGLTGGTMPLALTICLTEIYNAFYDDFKTNKTFYHGHSYTANPLACKIATAHLEILKEEKLPESKQSVLNYFHSRLKEFSDFDFVKDIRFKGFVGAIDLCQENGKPFDSSLRVGLQVYHNSLKKGLVLRPLGDTTYWFLPLIITKQDIKTIIDKSIEVIAKTIENLKK